MSRLPIITLLALSLLIPSDRVAGATVDLHPLGTGSVHYLGFITVYEATLLADSGATEAGILTAQNSFCLQLDYRVDLSADVFVEAAETILARQHAPATLARLREPIERLHRSYRDVQSGDSYRLCYDKMSQQSQLSLNNEPLVTVNSPLFATVYFGIWLSPQDPLDQSLRKKLFAGLSQGRLP